MPKRKKQIIVGVTLGAGAASIGAALFGLHHIKKKRSQATSHVTHVKSNTQESTDEDALSHFDERLIEQLVQDIERICKTPDITVALTRLISHFKKLSSEQATHQESALESFAWQVMQNLEAVAADATTLSALRVEANRAGDIFVSQKQRGQSGPIIISTNGKNSLRELLKQALSGPNYGLIKKRAYELEAGLCQLLWATNFVSAHPSADYEELRTAWATLCQDALINNWSPLESLIPTKGSEVQGGEWHVRRVLAEGLFSSAFPVHPQADFRVNAQDGNVAIELALLPHTALLGRQGDIPTDAKHPKLEVRIKKQQAATSFTIDMGLYLAQLAFRCAPSIKHVWLIIKGYNEAHKNEAVLLTADFDRYRFNNLGKLSHPIGYSELLHGFAADVRLIDGRLHAIAATASIHDARFCPPRRKEPIALKSQPLAQDAQKSLGARHAADLSIEEADTRVYIANQIISHLIDPTDDHAVEKNVRAILDVTSKVSDPSIERAAKRTIESILDGSCDITPQAIGSTFVQGDALTQAVIAARVSMHEGNFEEAIQIIEPKLRAIDAKQCFADSLSVEWRFFSDFASRALYNRINRALDRAVMLVPDAYFEAHFTLSQAKAMVGDAEGALVHAKRLHELAPMDAIAALNLAGILRQAQNPLQAAELMERTIPYAHNAISLGLLYFQLGLATWELGELELAQAAMVMALARIQHAPADILSAIAQLNQEIEHMGQAADVPYTLAAEGVRMAQMELPATKMPSIQEAQQTLAHAGIAEAPSQLILRRLTDGLISSTDEELFDVAKSFARSLYSFSHDAVLAHIANSLDMN